ncbi:MULTISPECIES: BON domain-containing protein [Niastella]|uniref:BON domain-containing protein n=1 Tax=Niastella soli TaxID=2821487 RepID=A0ABS3YQS3_9BACT|nr:BON domain-containing protein [Niastella soli]MBO9199795.1 BON domain-containing protein [Niastella soli]
MRKKSRLAVMHLLIIIISLSISSCGPKDSNIQEAVNTTISNNPATPGITASVQDGVVTLSGECKDEASKSAIESEVAKVKGVKKVVNNCTVTPPPAQAAPVTINPDETLTNSVNDAIKDYPGVSATVKDGVITLTGNIKRPDLQKLMMSLHTLKPKKIDNKLTIK